MIQLYDIISQCGCSVEVLWSLLFLLFIYMYLSCFIVLRQPVVFHYISLAGCYLHTSRSPRGDRYPGKAFLCTCYTTFFWAPGPHGISWKSTCQLRICVVPLFQWQLHSYTCVYACLLLRVGICTWTGMFECAQVYDYVTAIHLV